MKRLSLSFLLLFTRAAFAQPSGEPAPTPAEAQPAPMTPMTTMPAEPVPAPAPREPFVRIRAGANGAPAVFVPGVSYGANFSGRIGVQLKKMWGVYADVGGGFGF